MGGYESVAYPKDENEHNCSEEPKTPKSRPLIVEECNLIYKSNDNHELPSLNHGDIVIFANLIDFSNHKFKYGDFDTGVVSIYYNKKFYHLEEKDNGWIIPLKFTSVAPLGHWENLGPCFYYEYDFTESFMRQLVNNHILDTEPGPYKIISSWEDGDNISHKIRLPSSFASDFRDIEETDDVDSYIGTYQLFYDNKVLFLYD